MFNISIKTIISVTGDQKRMTYTYIKKVMHQCRCTSHCHFRRLIQLRHPCDTEVLQVQSAPPVCSHNAQINSRHIYISTVHVKRCQQQKCDMWPMCTTAYVCQLHRSCMDKKSPEYFVCNVHKLQPIVEIFGEQHQKILWNYWYNR